MSPEPQDADGRITPLDDPTGDRYVERITTTTRRRPWSTSAPSWRTDATTSPPTAQRLIHQLHSRFTGGTEDRDPRDPIPVIEFAMTLRFCHDVPVRLVVLNWLGLLLSTGLGISVRDPAAPPSAAPQEPAAGGEESATGLFTDAIAYVSGVLGIMLGLMLFFSVQVYEEVRQSAREEAVALADVFESADFFPTSPGDEVRRDICLMRSVATDSWTGGARRPDRR